MSLTREQAQEVRRRRAQGETQQSIAASFGVSQASISAIVLNKTHVSTRVKLTREQELQRKRRHRISMSYGISVDEYDARIAPGVCSACGDRAKLVLDHDHVSGALRGALCHPCNLALGHLRDDPARIAALAAYLEEYL